MSDKELQLTGVKRREYFEWLCKQVPLFPVKADKRPLVKDWGKTGHSQDPEQIRQWLDEHGNDVGFGIPTGKVSGFWVLDIDVKGGKKGAEFLKEKFKDIPHTLKVTTPSGGFHYYFKECELNPIKNAVDIFGKDSGIDVRGDGGYVVSPMSAGYRLDPKAEVRTLTKVPDAPDWVYRVLKTAKPTRVKKKKDVTVEHKPLTIGELRDILFTLDPNDEELSTRDGWQQVMRSVHSATEGDDEGKEMFLEWSLKADGGWSKDVESELERDWNSYDAEGGQTVGTLIHMIGERNLTVMPNAAISEVQDTMAIEVSTDDPKKAKFVNPFQMTRGKHPEFKKNTHNFSLFMEVKMLTDDITNPVNNRFCYDEFSGNVVWYAPLPGYRAKTGDPLQDHDVTHIRTLLSLHTNTDFGKDMALEGIVAHAMKNHTHPVRNFLNSLEWDGTPRLDQWLINAGALEDNIYHRAVSRKMLIAAVARIMVPGCKADNVVVLEGPQGCRKSTLVETLGYHNIDGKGWYAAPQLNIAGLAAGDTSAVTNTLGAWILEMPEMVSVTKADEAAVKAFITTSQDKVTLKYNKFATTHKRQYLLVGTMNPYGEGRYIKDHTGARRYWPVRMNRCESNPVPCEEVGEVLDQLYAEAMVAYNAGEAWHLVGEALELAIVEQGKRLQTNGNSADVDVFFTNGPGFQLEKLHTADICKQIWPHERKITQYHRDTITEYLTAQGWTAGRCRIDGKQGRGFMKVEHID